MSRCRKRQTPLQGVLCEEEDVVPETPTDDTKSEGGDFEPWVEKKTPEGRKSSGQKRCRRTTYDQDDMGTWSSEMFLDHCERNNLDPTSKPLSAISRKIRNRESAAATRRNAKLKVELLEEHIEALANRLDYYDHLLNRAREKNLKLQSRLDEIHGAWGSLKDAEEEGDEGGSPIVFVHGTPTSPLSEPDEESPCEPPPPLFDGMLSR